jgi:hypothetical protein
MTKTFLYSIVIAGLLGANALPAATRDFRGQGYRGYDYRPSDERGLYWYAKYFGRTEARPYVARGERDGLSAWELRQRAYDQGFYGAQHLHHSVGGAEVYALARETWFDREVAIVIDAHDGHVLDWVVLPY